MIRVSTNMPFLDSRFRAAEIDYDMNKGFNGISSSRSILELRDAPIDAAHATRLDSANKRTQQYQSNIDYTHSRLQLSEGYIKEGLSLLQRFRELAVQGANGILNDENRRSMAVEVDVMLEELVSVMNAKGGDGQYLFAGDDTAGAPFLISKGRVPGLRADAITDIEYAGGLSRSEMEINDGQTVKLNLQGNQIFWNEQQKIFGAIDTEGFTVREPNTFLIDGKQVVLETGDNVYSVVRKINESGSAVKASLDPVTGSLNLITLVSHQIWLEPVEGTALQELGLLSNAGNLTPPNNWHSDATVSGGALYDQLLSFRNALLENDQEKIGGAILGGLDEGLGKLLNHVADIGAISQRLEYASSRLSEESQILASWKSKLTDLDMTQAITDLKMLEYTQKAAMQVAGRILLPTLMDFLR